MVLSLDSNAQYNHMAYQEKIEYETVSGPGITGRTSTENAYITWWVGKGCRTTEE
ncbi:hypothetical protein [Albibacterium indicum]|uniref:hypothetical protein n=1 Tax=Albibacterium indicum TaxID=2292082 RepID=UPI0013009CB9|nr:hypothetical protein [Pedobacter indicus]